MHLKRNNDLVLVVSKLPDLRSHKGLSDGSLFFSILYEVVIIDEPRLGLVGLHPEFLLFRWQARWAVLIFALLAWLPLHSDKLLYAHHHVAFRHRSLAVHALPERNRRLKVGSYDYSGVTVDLTARHVWDKLTWSLLSIKKLDSKATDAFRDLDSLVPCRARNGDSCVELVVPQQYFAELLLLRRVDRPIIGLYGGLTHLNQGDRLLQELDQHHYGDQNGESCPEQRRKLLIAPVVYAYRVPQIVLA